jgi:hypothetical protein
MDKITEEVLTSLIKRIEVLEGLVPKTKEQVGTKYPEKKGMVTIGQLSFIKGLGGEPWPDMTSKEASEYIDKLKTQRNNQQESQKRSEQGSGERMQPAEYSKPLTQEEIDALPEEAFL